MDLEAKLAELGYRDVPAFTFAGTHAVGKCVKVYDGDSITVIMSVGGLPPMRYSVRLSGIDTAEMRAKTDEEKEFAKVTRDVCRQMLLDKLVDLELLDFDKYGRVLARVHCRDPACDMSDWLMENKYACAYDGGKKLSFHEWFLQVGES